MVKILILTKNNPVEVLDVMLKLYQHFTDVDPSIFVGSPQFTAAEIEKVKKVPYLQAYYPAIRAYKKIDQFAQNGKIRATIIVGAVDELDIPNYDAVLGLNNPDIMDYTEFPEEFNTTHMNVTSVTDSDILFDKIEEVIHFLDIMLKRELRKENVDE